MEAFGDKRQGVKKLWNKFQMIIRNLSIIKMLSNIRLKSKILSGEKNVEKANLNLPTWKQILIGV